MIALLLGCGPEPAQPPGRPAPEAPTPVAPVLVPGSAIPWVDPPFETAWPQFADCDPLAFAFQTGGIGGDKGTALAGTADGVIQGGNFSGSVRFGSGDDAVQLDALGASYGDGFVARYRHDGRLRWVRQHATDGASAVSAVAAHLRSGRVAAAGYFDQSPMVVEVGDRRLEFPVDNFNGYVVSYTADGDPEWGVTFDETDGYEQIVALAFGDDGVLYVAGTTDDRALHVVSTVGDRLDVALPASDYSSGFVTRVERNGSLSWVRTFSGARDTTLGGLAVLADGTVGAAGSFGMELVLAPGSPEERTHVARAYHGIFTSSWNPDGRLVRSNAIDPTVVDQNVFHAYGAAGLGDALIAELGAGAVWGAGLTGERTVPVSQVSLGRFGSVGELDSLSRVFGEPYFNGVRFNSLKEYGGTIAMAGWQNGAVTWGQGTTREAVLDSGPPEAESQSPVWEPILVTYDADGEFRCLWHLDSQVKGSMATAVAWDGLGGLWVTGYFDGTFVVNAGTASAVTLQTIPRASDGNHEIDAFLARFAPRR